MQTVFIIEDHEMIRAGLTASLKDTWQILGEASSMEEAKTVFSGLKEKPNLILLDIELGEEWGLDVISSLRTICKTENSKLPPILVYSVYDDYAHVNAAIRAGVRGYVCKSQSIEELLQAMKITASGASSFPYSIIQRLSNVSDILMGLTNREREIFNMVQRGFDNKKIAAEIGVSVRTIENNLSVIYDKTGVKNRTELERL